MLMCANLVVADTDFGLIEITPINTVVSQGEVYQAELHLKNPITELKKQNIKLYSSFEQQQPISPFLIELEKNTYFLYFEIPQSLTEGEYTLRIEEQSFLVNNVLVQEQEESKIIIQNSKPSVSFLPGVILLEKNKVGQFMLTAKSYDEKTEITFQVPSYVSHQYSVQQYLNPQTLRTFTFFYNTNEANTSEIVMIYGKKEFTIPILIEGNSKAPQNTSASNINETKKEGKAIAFFVENNKLVKEINPTESIEGNLKMANLLEKPLLNLDIRLDGDLYEIISITPTEIEKVNPLANFSVVMKINPTKLATKNFYTGRLIVSNEEYKETLDVQISIQKDEPQIKDTETTIKDDITEKTKPDEKEEAVNEIIPWNISGGYEQESKIAAKPIVSLITILLIVAIAVFLLSQKKTTKKRTFKDLMEESKKR